MNEQYINKVITGDNVELMGELAEGSVDLTVTSPPYDDLRKYNGYSFNFEVVAQELYRVTKAGGVVVWVVGDATKNGSESGNSFRQALFFMELGFKLYDTMIYKKDNPLPQNHRRYEQEFEYMFILSKGVPKTFNPVLIECKTVGQKYDYSKRGGVATLSEVNPAVRNKAEVHTTKSHKTKGNIWGYLVGMHKSTSDKIAFQHPAIFPEQLVNDHILSWSNEGDTVLDPFGGSGTTAKMAVINERRFIHIDVSGEYNEIARQRIGEVLG
ncbi:DNA-methyltransferase [Sporosarcina psychrophila]|uniref:Methyltransferase n=1 Tax=Sporosarcina psychrophila TaxID=1476 RepID=A0ABV2KBK5_SPOPS